VRSSSKLSIGLSARAKPAAFGGCNLTVGDSMLDFRLGGSCSICEFLSCSAGSREIFACLVFSSWCDRVASSKLTCRAMNTQSELTSITQYCVNDSAK